MVVLSEQVHVYDLKKLERIIKFETVKNSGGIAAVNSDKNQAIFACHSNELGGIQVINFDRNNEITKIKAHKSHVTALALNWQGSLVATASLEGQVVRVFRTSDGKMIQELRRGNDTCTIQCINFDPVSKWISCTSEKGTVHVFAINKEYHLTQSKEVEKEEKKVKLENETTVIGTSEIKRSTEVICENPKSMFSFLKPISPNFFAGEYSFAQLRIQDMHSFCTTYDLSVIAVTKDGNYYVADIDPILGGECRIIKHRSLI